MMKHDEQQNLGRIFSADRSVVVDLLFNVLPIVYGSSVFVFVLLCITLCSFLF